MSLGNTGLLDLSPELLLNVASFCEARTLLSLTRTCRSIRRLSTLVYQEALRNVLTKLQTEWCHDKAPQRSIRKPPFPAVFRSWLGDDERIWARFLFAIATAEEVAGSFCWSKDCKNYHKLRAVDKKEIIALCEYLPQLVVSGCHPILCQNISSLVRHLHYFHADLTWASCTHEDPSLVVPNYDGRFHSRINSIYARRVTFPEQWPEWFMPDHSLHSRITFLIAWETIHLHCSSTGELFPREGILDDEFAGQVGFQIEAHHLTLRTQLEVSGVPRFYGGYYRTIPFDTLLQQQANLALVVAEMATIMRAEQYDSDDERERYLLPLSHRLPVVDLEVAPPMPFYDSSDGADRSWDSWLCRHNAVASQARNIEGEWIGMSICDFTPGIINNIQFRVVSPTDHERRSGLAPRDMVIVGTGYHDEDDGRFKSHGSINQKTGQFKINLKYERRNPDTDLHEHWRGAMTPFGLVGAWGYLRAHAGRWTLPDGFEIQGWVWLYRKSWCRAPTEKDKDLLISQVDDPPHPGTEYTSVDNRGRPWLL